MYSLFLLKRPARSQQIDRFIRRLILVKQRLQLAKQFDASCITHDDIKDVIAAEATSKIDIDISNKEYQALFNFLNLKENQPILDVIGATAFTFYEKPYYLPTLVAAIKTIADQITFMQKNPFTVSSNRIKILAFEERQTAEAWNNRVPITQLINDIIKQYNENCLPPPLRKRDSKLSLCIDEYSKDYDEQAFLKALAELCKEYQTKKGKKISAESDLFCRSILSWLKNYYPTSRFTSVEQLRILEEKNDAIRSFKDEMWRLEKPGFFYDVMSDPKNQEDYEKFYAYENLISELQKSSPDTPLRSILAKDSPTMNKPVMIKKNGIRAGVLLPGRPNASIQEVLSYNRGLKIKLSTSEKNLKKWRRQFVDHELESTRKRLKQLLANSNPWETVLKDEISQFKGDRKGKEFIIYGSEHFPSELRVMEVDLDIGYIRGKEGGEVNLSIKRIWKLDKNNNIIGHKDVVGRYAAKRVIAKKEMAALKHELELTQQYIQSTRMKLVVDNKNNSIVKMALVKGEELHKLIKQQTEIQQAIAGRKEKIEKIERLITTIESKLKNNEYPEAQVSKKQNKVLVKKQELERYRREIPRLESLLWTKEQRLKIGIAIGNALQNLHAAGIVHLDLKPTNIILDMSNPDDPIATIIDFDVSNEINKKITKKVGTVTYQAIEMFSDNIMLNGPKELTLNPGHDMYSFARLLEEVLICPPFRARNDNNEYLAVQIHRAKELGNDAASAEVDKHFGALIEESKINESNLAESLLESTIKPILLSNEDERPSLDICVKALVEERLKMSGEEEPFVRQGYDLAMETKRQLRNLRDSQKEDGKHSLETIIERFELLITNSISQLIHHPAAMQEFFNTLGIRSLKKIYDTYSHDLNEDNIYTLKENILDYANTIIQNYMKYKIYAEQQFMDHTDRNKINLRYEKYHREITETTLDGMAALNEKNQTILDKYQEQIKAYETKEKNGNELPSEQKIPLIPIEAKRQVTIINKIIGNFVSTMEFDTSDLAAGKYATSGIDPAPPEPASAVPDIDPAAAKIINEFRKKAKKSHNLIDGKHYKQNLIYRAIAELPTYLMAGITFYSLEELLNYQQKKDTLFYLTSLNITGSKDKKEAFMKLTNAIINSLNDHSLSVSDIISKTGRESFTYFTKKLDCTFRLFKNSADLFDQICHLPPPRTFLTEMKSKQIKQIIDKFKNLEKKEFETNFNNIFKIKGVVNITILNGSIKMESIKKHTAKTLRASLQTNKTPSIMPVMVKLVPKEIWSFRQNEKIKPHLTKLYFKTQYGAKNNIEFSEFCENGSLRTDGNQRSLEERKRAIIGYLEDITKMMLDFKHEHSFYTDIKPDNFNINDKGHLVIADTKSFINLEKDENEEDISIVRRNRTVVSFSHLPPDSYFPNLHKKDIDLNILQRYLIGLTLFEYITGDYTTKRDDPSQPHTFNFESVAFQGKEGEFIQYIITGLIDPVKQLSLEDVQEMLLEFKKATFHEQEQVLIPYQKIQVF